MISTVAVLPDVHGVLPVVDAVLAEPEVAGADLVVVTGDHAAGAPAGAGRGAAPRSRRVCRGVGSSAPA